MKTCTQLDLSTTRIKWLAGAHAALESDGAAPNVWDEDFSEEYALAALQSLKLTEKKGS